jgi:hypothetical protein
VAFADSWHLLADGGGSSLTLVRPRPGLDLDNPANWRPSTSDDGSPGANDPGTAFSGDPFADEDGDGVTAFTEYALGSSDNDRDHTAGIRIEPQPDGSMLFSFLRAPAADDAIVVAEVSGDLATWHSDAAWLVPYSQERQPDGRLLTRYAPGPAIASLGTRVFFHLRASARQ